MSHAAIVGGLARNDLSTGERPGRMSLASFASRQQLAWPGVAAAAARASLGGSRCPQAREQLVRPGLLEVEKPGVARGQASAVRLRLAQSGPRGTPT